jgi:hypothetical protein
MCLVLPFTPARAVEHSFVEGFTSLQNCDTVNTTAWWDTVAGELKLPPFQLRLAGSNNIEGNAQRIAIAGDYAYVANLAGMWVLDISDPTDPTYAGRFFTPGYAYGVAISGNYAFVAVSDSGLSVIDITDPTSPTLAGGCDTPGHAFGVAISGNYAYVADGYDGGLQVVDIADPTSPALAGNYDTPGTARSVAVSGDYAYVVDYAGLQVIDISEPTSPTLAGNYDTPDYARDIAISGNYAYVADEASGLQIIDITNPTSPVLAGSHLTLGSANSIAISGDRAYIADYGQGIYVADVSDPTDPTYAASVVLPGDASGITLSGEYAFLAGGYEGGVQVIQASDPTSPTPMGSYDTSGNAFRVAISGDYAYVADGISGLQAIDISDPTNPLPGGNYSASGYPRDVAISGDYAYVAGQNDGLLVIDISDPTSLTLAGTKDTPGSAQGVAISGNYAYVADGIEGLYAVNISVPTNPQYTGGYNTPGYSGGIAVSGNHAYVADGSDGLQIIDITQPATCLLAGTYSTPGNAKHVAISGDYAYVADYGSGLLVMDISDPTTPTLAGSYDTPGNATGVALVGNRAYVADYDSGLQVIDISDPTNPTLADSYSKPARVWGVTCSDDHAYAANGNSGLQIIEAFQRLYDLQSNMSRSLTLSDGDDLIVQARLSASYSDSIRWEASSDSGSSWRDLVPGGAYQDLITPGSDLMWRSSHFYTGARINPTCTNLEIEALYEFPVVGSVMDIPNDQGKQVRITWARSGHDHVGSSTPISEYAVYRRIGDDLMPADEVTREATMLGSPSFYPPGNWDFILTVPADAEDEYAVVVPTLADSTISDGMAHAVFFVRARTSTPGAYFDSYPDSGYSLDNLAPAAPLNLEMTSPTDLAWEESEAEDFDYFTVYGSSTPELDETAVLVGYTIGITMDITEDQYHYYHVTATDFSGNEGEASSVGNAYAGIVGVKALPAVFALEQSQPNPFGVSTEVRFDVPRPSDLSIKIYDAEGRLVKMLAQGRTEPGRHVVIWKGIDSGGSPVSPGIYFIKMEAAGFTAMRKVTLLR